MSSKLRIRVGDVELDYEGTEEFLKQEIPGLLKTALELYAGPGAASKANKGVASGNGAGNGAGNGGNAMGTTATIAARLKVGSGPELLVAAGLRMTIVDKKGTFTRQELLAEMQGASSYYRKSYSANLTKIIDRRIEEGDLTETSKDTYALTASALERLEKQLANP